MLAPSSSRARGPAVLPSSFRGAGLGAYRNGAGTLVEHTKDVGGRPDRRPLSRQYAVGYDTSAIERGASKAHRPRSLTASRRTSQQSQLAARYAPHTVSFFPRFFTNGTLPLEPHTSMFLACDSELCAHDLFSRDPFPQPAPRKTRLASDKYHARNKGDEMKSSRPQARYTVGPVLLGFFLFVVVGSCKCTLRACVHLRLTNSTIPRPNVQRPDPPCPPHPRPHTPPARPVAVPDLQYCCTAILQVIRSAQTGVNTA